MLLKKIIHALPLSIASLGLLGLLAGCNGPSDDNDNGGGEDGSYSISVSYQTVVNGQCDADTDSLTFDINESFCAVAQLKLSNSNVSGAIVNFTPDFGEASAESKLTDSDGLASVFISSTSNAVGAGTLMVSFNPDDADSVSASKNYQFEDTNTVPTPDTISVTASITQAGQTVTRFKIDQAVLLTASVMDGANQPIANQLVSFQAGNASLSPDSALTTAEGIASISYTASSSELGAYTLVTSTEFNDETISGTSDYEVLAGDEVIPEGTLKFGFIDNSDPDADVFIEGKLGSTLTADADGNFIIGAGASFGVYADVIVEAADGTFEPLQSPVSVSFTSDCVTNTDAAIDSPVVTSTGTASSTYQDLSCSGNSVRSEQIVATALIGSESFSANFDFSLERQTLGSLSFVSADPTQIRIKGAGGTGSTETSLVTFLISSANGQPIALQDVDFSLDTIVGGLSFSNGNTTSQATSNSDGLVSVTVQSGTIPTPVRVLASATDTDSGDTITTQSEQLTVNTGLPQQLGFSISPSLFNPEAGNNNGEEVTMTVFASDSFGNPAPDDTTVNFTAEGGQIQPSCSTVNGSCSVIWTSTDPRPTDHRVTVLAYALGHETFFDTNGNNIFDDADGGVITDACLDGVGNAIACTGNGMDRETYHQGGFSDLGDAFRDDDESGFRRDGEPYFNTTGDTYNAHCDVIDCVNPFSGDGMFNGPQCEGSLCGEDQANKTYIRAATVLTMSGSGATIITTDVDSNPISDLTLAPEAMSTIFVELYDSAKQVLPAGTTLTVTATNGAIDFNGYTVPNKTCYSFTDASLECNEVATRFTYTASDEVGQDTITLTTTTPAGLKTEVFFSVTVE
ncbi:Ig-like domain-containing protein [Shewanella sp. 1_MG-2023]|uniref:Ig-like domain-containing protein n=1 Tax=unclassified Shewanella TaxID=196818 RepID=UPI0026E46072|nr:MULTISPECIES: Ig-like domain-containing protein [unclassified Shewanella]MDO6610605.1 Ig-like domain-containing protein [Shewanella sp. 7_MG-2023]MDO6770730.1 Ig-like domain-containing protein [Shewanella sp. 2_MG-2023]MDO6793252.1 Ig-like domain-containing protein [Shewanella sp. 1_MG-2023]